MPGCSRTCCPYGSSWGLPFGLSFLAVIFTWVGVWSCYYIEFQQVAALSGGYTDRYLGPWTIEKYEVTVGAGITVEQGPCISWEDSSVSDVKDLFDAAFKSSRAFSFMGWLIGFWPWVAFLFSGCFVCNANVLKLLIPAWAFAGICMLLSLTLLASDLYDRLRDSKLSGGGACAIIAFFFWFAAAATIPCMKERDDLDAPPPATAAAAGGADKTEVVEKTVTEDGKTYKMTTTTVTKADGSKTVTETKEEVADAEAAEADIDVGKGED